MNDWVTIPERMVEDKPLPPGLFWHLKEDSNRYASIRDESQNSLVFGVEFHGDHYNCIKQDADGTNKQIAEAATLEEAVNYIYTRAMLGE